MADRIFTNTANSTTAKATYEIHQTDSIPNLIFDRAERQPDGISFEERTDMGEWRPVPMTELSNRITDIQRGLMATGISAGDAVAILGSTSVEWMLLDLAILSLGGITVPIYESDSSAQIQHILTDAKVVWVFTDTTSQQELVKSVAPETVRGIEALEQGAIRRLQADAAQIPEQRARGARQAVRVDDVATIIYTSGTTGLPKGVVLTHRNIVATVHAVDSPAGVPQITKEPDTRVLLFLPLAHILARYVMYLIMSTEGRVGFSPDTKNLLPDIATFKPTTLLAVPRVLEKVYGAAMGKAGAGIKSKIFSWSAKQARLYTSAKFSALGRRPSVRVRHAIANKLVLGKVRAALGPNIKHLISGGAPLAPDLNAFFIGLDLVLLQGYGLSESTGPICVQRIGDNQPGNVGPVLPGNSVKIADDGEILLKGDAVFGGYHNLPDLNKEVLEDGWFHSGDLGALDKKGRLSITGRKKELIVTAGGKNVSPEVLEEQLVTHPLIGHVIVVGDGRPYIGALISLDTDSLPSWLQRKGLPVVDAAQAAQLPEVKDSLDRAIARANKAVSRAESIRRFKIIDAAFTVENGYLTPSMKLKRSTVLADFAGDIDALYDEGEQAKNGK